MLFPRKNEIEYIAGSNFNVSSIDLAAMDHELIVHSIVGLTHPIYKLLSVFS